MTDNITPPAAPPEVGASGVMNAPLTPETAAQRMEDLKASPEFMAKVAAKDPAAFDEYNKAWRVAHGLTPEPLPPQSPTDVDTERDARVVAAVQQHAAVLRRQGFNDDQVTEIVGRRPITLQEREFHQNQIERLRRDQAFMARWSNGDIEAIHTIQKHSIALSLPTGTLQDIERWANG